VKDKPANKLSDSINVQNRPKSIPIDHPMINMRGMPFRVEPRKHNKDAFR
jgi:hypothetical protein